MRMFPEIFPGIETLWTSYYLFIVFWHSFLKSVGHIWNTFGKRDTFGIHLGGKRTHLGHIWEAFCSIIFLLSYNYFIYLLIIKWLFRDTFGTHLGKKRVLKRIWVPKSSQLSQRTRTARNEEFPFSLPLDGWKEYPILSSTSSPSLASPHPILQSLSMIYPAEKDEPPSKIDGLQMEVESREEG